MISKPLLSLAKRLDWTQRPQDELIFGTYNGYLFSLLDGKGFKAFITPIAGISPGALEAVRQYLDENSKQLQLFNVSISDNFLCVRLKSGLFPPSVDKLEDFLSHLSGILSLNEVPADRCLVCGQPAQSQGLYMGLYCPLHADCRDADLIDYTQPAQSPAQENKEATS